MIVRIVVVLRWVLLLLPLLGVRGWAAAWSHRKLRSLLLCHFLLRYCEAILCRDSDS